MIPRYHVVMSDFRIVRFLVRITDKVMGLFEKKDDLVLFRTGGGAVAPDFDEDDNLMPGTVKTPTTSWVTESFDRRQANLPDTGKLVEDPALLAQAERIVQGKRRSLI